MKSIRLLKFDSFTVIMCVCVQFIRFEPLNRSSVEMEVSRDIKSQLNIKKFGSLNEIRADDSFHFPLSTHIVALSLSL